jgi:hypothetical protein
LNWHGGEQAREDFGPTDRAMRLTRSSDGVWHDVDQGTLYLAPDRLLFNWRDAILCSAMQRVERTLKQADHVLSSQDNTILRIDYTGSDGSSQTVGFQVSRRGEWVQQLQRKLVGRPLRDLGIGREEEGNEL